MEIQITNPIKNEIFATIFQNIRIFNEHVVLQFSDKGLYIQGMDNSHVSIYELTIPAIWFDKYVAPTPASVSIGLNSMIFSKILASRDKTQEMRIVYNAADTVTADKMWIYFTGAGFGVGTPTAAPSAPSVSGAPMPPFDRNFEMLLVDITAEHLAIPEIEYQAEITVPSAKIAAVVNQLKMFDETMNILCNEQKIYLSAGDNSTATMTVEIKIEEVTEFAIDEDKELRLSFSLNYVHNICQFHKIARDVEICLCEEYPMRMTYVLGDGGTGVEGAPPANMRFYLAPKIGEE